MKLAFHTNALGNWQIDKLMGFAGENGFQAIEVGASIPLDEKAFRTASSNTGIEIAALIYCRNFLDPDPSVAAAHLQNIQARIRLAGALGIPLVITSTGRPTGVTPEAGFDRAAELLTSQVLPLARERRVQIAIENCPDMGNVAISPYMLRKLFEALPELGLAYDPSHLVRLMCDPYGVLNEFGNRIQHVHAKDTEILHDRLREVGIEGQGWWRYRLPGWGALDWRRIATALIEAGYGGAISIEHEDPAWEGSDDKATDALKRSRDFLRGVWG